MSKNFKPQPNRNPIWMHEFADECNETRDVLLAARDEFAASKAAETGLDIVAAANVVDALLREGMLRFELRYNLIGDLEGVDLHRSFRAVGEAVKAVKEGSVRV